MILATKGMGTGIILTVTFHLRLYSIHKTILRVGIRRRNKGFWKLSYFSNQSHIVCKQRDWDSILNCSDSPKPCSFHRAELLCSIELYLATKSGTVLGPNISSMNELRCSRLEGSESVGGSMESKAAGQCVNLTKGKTSWARTAERMFMGRKPGGH